MKIIGLVLFLLFSTFTICAEDFPEPYQIIQKEDRFIFTDGSAYYLFKKDGTFQSEPLGISGRTITGTWKLQDNLFVIQGKWSRVNGLSQEDDYRQMIIFISSPTASKTVERLSPAFGQLTAEIYKLKAKIYQCYFEIEYLQKITKPLNKS